MEGFLLVFLVFIMGWMDTLMLASDLFNEETRSFLDKSFFSSWNQGKTTQGAAFLRIVIAAATLYLMRLQYQPETYDMCRVGARAGVFHLEANMYIGGRYVSSWGKESNESTIDIHTRA
jgi:hypothetical protein